MHSVSLHRHLTRCTVHCTPCSQFKINQKYYLAVPPTNIQILNYHSGSRIEVKENEEVEIACKVSNAKPKAKILWYRNNVSFNPGLGE